MAELGFTFDPKAHLAWKLLNERKDEEAKAIIRDAFKTGRPSLRMQEVARTAFDGGRDRGPFRWLDIGLDAYWLDAEGVPYGEIVRRLASDYSRSESHVRACITMYRKGLLEGAE